MNPWLPGYFLFEEEGIGWEARLSKVVRSWLMPWREKQTFTFTLSEDRPLTFIQSDGTMIRPCWPGQSFEFDFASIPPVAQGLVRKEGVEYPYHDRGYEVGYLIIRLPGSTEWKAVAVERWELDALLYAMGRGSTNKRGRFKGGLIWTVVRSCGWSRYHAHSGPLPTREPEERPDVDEPEVIGI